MKPVAPVSAPVATLTSSLSHIVPTMLSLTFNVMAGYAFAKLRFRGRDRLFRFLLTALVIPAQVAGRTEICDLETPAR